MRMTHHEYRRQVFNKVLTECLVRLQYEILGESVSKAKDDPARIGIIGKMTEAFYRDELDLEHSTIAQTRKRLSEANEFVRDCVNTAEEVANDHADYVKDQGIVVDDEQDMDLSEEDKTVIDTVFDVKKPDPEIEKIRDATVAALVAEDKKAQEIKDAVNLAKSTVEPNTDDAKPGEKLEETVRRLEGVGPTSLMNGILNHFSTLAIKDISESGNYVNVQSAMSDNREIIKERAMIMYSLFETASTLGIHRYTPEEVKDLTYRLYYGRD